MYKSRVETFNQVCYFHHLNFLVILQGDGMKNKLWYFICVPEQKYRSGQGRQNSVLSVAMIVPQVAGPMSSCLRGDGLLHLDASTCPGFPYLREKVV